MYLRRTISSTSSSVNDAATAKIVKDVNEKSNKTTMSASTTIESGNTENLTVGDKVKAIQHRKNDNEEEQDNDGEIANMKYVQTTYSTNDNNTSTNDPYDADATTITKDKQEDNETEKHSSKSEDITETTQRNNTSTSNTVDSSLLYYRRLTGRLLYYVYVDGSSHLDMTIATRAKRNLLNSIIAARQQDLESWEDKEELQEEEQEEELEGKAAKRSHQDEEEEAEENKKIQSKEKHNVKSENVEEEEVTKPKETATRKERIEAARLINTLVIFIKQENMLEKLLNSSSAMTKLTAQRKLEANADIRLSQVERQILLERVCDVIEKRLVSLVMASRLLRAKWPRFLLSGTAEAQQQFMVQSILSWLSEELRAASSTAAPFITTNSDNDEDYKVVLNARAARLMLDNMSFVLRSSVGHSFVGPLANLAMSDLHSVNDPNALISLMYSVYVSHGKPPSSFWEQIVERLIILNNTLREGVEDVLNDHARTQSINTNSVSGSKKTITQGNSGGRNNGGGYNRHISRKNIEKSKLNKQLDEEDKNESEWNSINMNENALSKENKSTESVLTTPSAGHVFSGLTTRQIFRLLNLLRKQRQYVANVSLLHELCDQALKNIVFEMEAAGFAMERSTELSKVGIYRRVERVCDLNSHDFVELLMMAGELGISFSTTSGNRVADLLIAPLIPFLDREITLKVIHAMRLTHCQSINLYNVLAIEVWRRGFGAPYTLILSKSLLRSLLKDASLFSQVSYHDLVHFYYELCELCVRRVHSGELLSMAEILYGLSRRFAGRSSHGLRIRNVLDLFCKQFDRLMQLELLSLSAASRLLEYTVVLGMRESAPLYPGTARLIATREVVYKRTLAQHQQEEEEEQNQQYKNSKHTRGNENTHNMENEGQKIKALSHKANELKSMDDTNTFTDDTEFDESLEIVREDSEKADVNTTTNNKINTEEEEEEELSSDLNSLRGPQK